MTAVAGSMESVVLDGRSFSVTADADSQRKMGGWENDVQANGDGTVRLIKTRVPFSISDLALVIDDERGDAEFLSALQARNELFPVTASYASGATFQGTGAVTGEVTTSSQNQTASVSLMGSGELTKQ